MKLNRRQLRRVILREMGELPDFDLGPTMAAADPQYHQGYQDNMGGMELPASGDSDYLAGWQAANVEKEDAVYNRQEDQRRTDRLTRHIRRARGHRLSESDSPDRNKDPGYKKFAKEALMSAVKDAMEKGGASLDEDDVEAIIDALTAEDIYLEREET